MDRQKIILLGPAYPYRGGIAALNERLAREMLAEGHDVELCTFTLQYPSLLFPGKTQYSAEPAPTDLRIERRINSVNPFNWLAVGRALAQKHPDLIIIPFWMPVMAPAFGSLARIVKRRSPRTRLVSILHNLMPHERRVGDRQLVRYFVGALDGCVALSKVVCDETAAFAPSLPCLFSPHPLYDNFGTPVAREESCRHLGLDATFRYLLFFGLIRDYKGLDWLLQAYAEAKRDGALADVRLIVAGEFYGDGTKYHALATSLGIDGDIVWRTEFVPDGEVRYYFGAADLIVQPYKSATQSGVTQIAYHFEKPMLVTRVGGLAEIVPDGRVGYVVAPEPQAIAAAIIDFCTRRDNTAFADGIREEKKKYSWSNLSRALRTV